MKKEAVKFGITMIGIFGCTMLSHAAALMQHKLGAEKWMYESVYGLAGLIAYLTGVVVTAVGNEWKER